LQRGFELNYLLNLTENEKLMFIASMELYTEYENKKISALFNVGG